MVQTRSTNLNLSDLLNFENYFAATDSEDENIDSVQIPSPQVTYIPSTMSTDTCEEITNPYDNDINLKDKTGVTLFTDSCKGLPDDEKLQISIEDAQTIKDEFERENSDYVWGTDCMQIPDKNGVLKKFFD